MLTHRNIIANLQQSHAWIAPFLREEEIIITACRCITSSP